MLHIYKIVPDTSSSQCITRQYSFGPLEMIWSHHITSTVNMWTDPINPHVVVAVVASWISHLCLWMYPPLQLSLSLPPLLPDIHDTRWNDAFSSTWILAVSYSWSRLRCRRRCWLVHLWAHQTFVVCSVVLRLFQQHSSSPEIRFQKCSPQLCFVVYCTRW